MNLSLDDVARAITEERRAWGQMLEGIPMDSPNRSINQARRDAVNLALLRILDRLTQQEEA
ncbi:hypothetical protein ACFORJ_01615 [Corynebacterium hansenii]|uniref:Uncharacterized protein n=1 Tax=Corynebacterium hansenii TaxID=394964 RepID=A0ABV7ZN94_9CORY|nr:hypothetical protein [Corynebacterium hansenii]WJY99303.1 hypothetical protein CHAN_03375 [Corynebacterium hansenii]